MFAVFRQRNFALLWTAQFISTIGNGVLAVAASLMVYRVTSSAMSVGMMMLTASLPSLLVGLIAGVAVDRFDRKRIMIASTLICAVVVAVIPIFLRAGIGWLYFLVALSSAVEQFFAPAQASILPESAPDDQLAAANAMMTISLYGAVTIGNSIAGLIAAYASLNAAFLVDAMSFVLSAGCILMLHVAPLGRSENAGVASVWGDLRTGVAFVLKTPILLSLAAVFLPVFIDYGLTNSLTLPFVIRVLDGNEFQYGLVEATFAIGFAAGGLLMANLADRLHGGQWIGISIVGMSIFSALVASSRGMPPVFICSTMIGVLNAPSYIGRQLLIQRTTPRQIRGRVSSVFLVLRDTAFMIGMASAGLADVVSVRVLLLICAAGLGVFGILALILPGLGQPSAEWRRILAMLRSQPEGHAELGLGRAATLADIDQLGAVMPAISHWSRGPREDLAAQTRVFDVQPGAAIVRQGERTNMAYFLLSGRTVASRATDGEPSRILDFHNPGDFFGEIAAFTDLPRTASVSAVQPTRVVQAPAPVLHSMARDPHVGRLLLGKLHERMLLLNLIGPPGSAGIANRP